MINHLAIIPDGNRRWAKAQWKTSFFGHKAWVDNVEHIVESAWERGVEYISFWGLSTENMKKRDPEEIKYILSFINNIEKLLAKMMKKWLRFDFIWDTQLYPKKTLDVLEDIRERTKNNTGITFILALVYGWRDEIIRGIKKYITENWNQDELTEDSFLEYLDTWRFPPPCMIVRTWWWENIRHSGYFLYASSYSEYFFSDKKWPDFNLNELDKVFDSFSKKKRNFWK